MSNTIFPELPYADTIVPLDHLRVIESGIITAMLESQDQYQKIKTTLSKKDFVFQNHAAIFDSLIKHSYEELCEFLASDMQKHGFANSFLGAVPFLNANVFYTVFSIEPSSNIDVDMQEMLHYSREKQKAIELNSVSHEKCTITFTIVHPDGICTAIYTHNRLCELNLANAPFLPEEFCDTFSLTLGNFMPSIENMEANEAGFISCFVDPIGECAIVLKVNVEELRRMGLYDVF